MITNIRVCNRRQIYRQASDCELPWAPRSQLFNTILILLLLLIIIIIIIRRRRRRTYYITGSRWSDLPYSLPILLRITRIPRLLYGFLGAFAKLQIVAVSFFMSVGLCVHLSARNKWAPNRRIFMKFYIFYFRKSVDKIQFSLKSDKNSRYFTWRPIYIYAVSCSVLLTMRYVSDKIFWENQHTQFMFNNFFFRNSCRLWDNVENFLESDRAQMIIWCMRFEW